MNPQMGPLLAHYPVYEPRIVIGLISGTSADGVDVAKVRLPAPSAEGALEVLHFETVPYPAPLKERVMEAAADKLSLRQTALLNTALGEFFAQVAVDAIGGDWCDLVASHGQTVCHLPEERTTLQLGEGAIIASRTGVVTVSDFRQSDMAQGGQGAPLVPLFDAYLLSSPDKTRVAVNLGGIANLTVIPPDGRLLAWDTGPANCVSDCLCRLHGKGDFDPGGEMAAGGTVNEALLGRLLKMDYFRRLPPKSTGLEDFGRDFVEGLAWDVPFPDLLRTLLALSAQTLVDGIHQQVAEDAPFEIVFAGGGTSNTTLMQEIEQRLQEKARSLGRQAPAILGFSSFGVAEDAREAVAFAFLGDRTVRGLVGTVPSTTGAGRAAILGKVSFPP